MMHPFWIDKAGSRGVGVTARSEADALVIYKAAFGDTATKATRISSADELDQNHVVPNMGNLLKRGVWFPLGFEQTSD